MTTEQNQPEASQGDAQVAQQGQGQGQHRKRRRRRKSKGGAQANGQSAPQQNQASQPQQQSQPQKSKSSSQNRHFQKSNNGGGYGNGNGNGNGNGGPRGRKGGGKPRKQQTFVGPMDHIYRGSNGNIADSPPSTIDLRMVNGNVGSYGNEYIYHEPVALVIREDAPTRVFCFIEDLFFLAKIQEISKKTGVKVAFVKAEKEALAKLTDSSEEERPALIIFDLNNVSAKPLTTIPKLRAKLKKGKTSIIGFLSHVQGDLKVKAVEAGCDTVMPRSAFSQNLPNLMRRYGAVDEEDDYNVMVN